MSDHVYLNSIDICGFRGFQKNRTINFAIPNGKIGSGLTVITGPNNSGKSTIIEALKIRESSNSPSFTIGMRNIKTEVVTIKYNFLKDENSFEEKIESIRKGSSETKKCGKSKSIIFFTLPSRRAFSPFFNKGQTSRDYYISNTSNLDATRRSSLSIFERRLFDIENDDKKKQKFDELISRILGYKPAWAIDQSDNGQYFLKFYNEESSHSSDGLGEGIVSLFVISDALYENNKNEIIIIDEPELSLHPSLQKRLADVLSEYSKEKQIIISTHSPYFVDMYNLINGGKLARVITGNNGTEIYQLNNNEIINKLIKNENNPHILGLDAKELFFLEDKIILVEGQEDVIFLPKILKQLNKIIEGNIFGWGAGGASNIRHICTILKDLGFEKVVGVFDNDKQTECKQAEKEFSKYKFLCIPADDIRTKEARKAIEKKEGLLEDDNKVIRDKYKEDTNNLIDDINKYLSNK